MKTEKGLKVLCDHQTGYLPWLGFFHRVSLCDAYVSLDTVNYNPRSYDSRNKIKTPDGFKWLNVPVKKGDSRILKDIKINNDINWKDEHLKSIKHSYSNSAFFGEYFKRIEEIFSRKHEFLMDLNEDFAKFFFKELGISVEFFKASDFEIGGSKNEYLINICRKFNADVYVFGQMGKEYVDAAMWEASGIKVYFHDYKHPTYAQKFGKFESHLSVIDLLFNEGKKSMEIIGKDNISRAKILESLK